MGPSCEPLGVDISDSDHLDTNDLIKPMVCDSTITHVLSIPVLSQSIQSITSVLNVPYLWMIELVLLISEYNGLDTELSNKNMTTLSICCFLK